MSPDRNEDVNVERNPSNRIRDASIATLSLETDFMKKQNLEKKSLITDSDALLFGEMFG